MELKKIILNPEDLPLHIKIKNKDYILKTGKNQGSLILIKKEY